MPCCERRWPRWRRRMQRSLTGLSVPLTARPPSLIVQAWEGIALLGACGLVIVGCVVASAQVSRLLDAAQGSEWQRVSMRVGGKGYDTCV